jgi:ribosomal subunit interface protein
MDISIFGHNVDLPDRFREYVTTKSDKVAHLADRSVELQIRVSRHLDRWGAPAGDRVELTLIGSGPVVRAEAQADDKYPAFDVALGKLVERLRRLKDRKKIHRGGAHHTPSLREVATQSFADVDITPADADVIARVEAGDPSPLGAREHPDQSPGPDESPAAIVRRKVFPSVSLTADEAVDRMELLGHDFYLFIDSDSVHPSVVYCRKGWEHGLISLDRGCYSNE